MFGDLMVKWALLTVSPMIPGSPRAPGGQVRHPKGSGSGRRGNILGLLTVSCAKKLNHELITVLINGVSNFSHQQFVASFSLRSTSIAAHAHPLQIDLEVETNSCQDVRPKGYS